LCGICLEQSRTVWRASCSFFLRHQARTTQESAPWHDPSSHRVQFVTVEKGVNQEEIVRHLRAFLAELNRQNLV
jgi:hypothetical protein